MSENHLTSIELYKKLSEPIPKEEVQLKVQSYSGDKKSGLIVAYIDARTVQERLDSVLGALGWSTSYHDLVMTDKHWVARCTLTIYGVDEQGNRVSVSRADVGESDGGENVAKAAHSDAFKRAAVHFGIGRELYSLEKVWADLVDKGKSKVIKDVVGTKRKLFGGVAANEGRSQNGRGNHRERVKQEPSEARNGSGGENNESVPEAMATDGQKVLLRELVTSVLGGKWDKIVIRFKDREAYAQGIEKGLSEEDATLGAMTYEDAKKTIHQIREYGEKKKNIEKNP